MSWYEFLPVAVVAILGLAVLYALSLGPAVSKPPAAMQSKNAGQ
jgi:hypothetical protein